MAEAILAPVTATSLSFPWDSQLWWAGGVGHSYIPRAWHMARPPQMNLHFSRYNSRVNCANLLVQLNEG